MPNTCSPCGYSESTATGTPIGKPSPNPAPPSPMTTAHKNHCAVPRDCISLDRTRRRSAARGEQPLHGASEVVQCKRLRQRRPAPPCGLEPVRAVAGGEDERNAARRQNLGQRIAAPPAERDVDDRRV